jgi:signal peptidase I
VKKGSEPAAKPEQAGKRSTALDYLFIIIAAVGLALVLQAFVVKPYRIPSESMVPTLQVGQHSYQDDRVLVNRFLYHLRDPKRGDIVVFRWPVDGKTTFIKRLIGLPGDTLSLKDGKVYVNGKPIDEPYLATEGGQPVPTAPILPQDGTSMVPAWSLAQPYTVPEGQYFMMGDNRGNSDDSRQWGPVPKENLIGEAFFRYWPLDRIGTL